MLLDERGESGVDLTFAAGLQDMDLYPFPVRRFLHLSYKVLGSRIGRVHQQGDHPSPGNQLGQQLTPLVRQTEAADAREVAAPPQAKGGNLTGISFLVVELTAKRFDLISELVPQAKVIALLINPNNEGTERQTRDAQEATRGKGRQLHILRATSETEIDAAFASLVTSPADAILVGADALFVNRREQLVALASRHAVPAIYQWREFVDSGGLISYGPSGSSVARQVGIYAGKILKGAKPADLPVQQPTKFELVINLKTAKALGLTVPQSLLARAEEVIE